jgi:exodeoxyribonuclease VII large subunit
MPMNNHSPRKNQNSSQNDLPLPVYTVTDITREIKLVLENTFGNIWVEGEISNFKAASSGHYYFSLKDSNAVLGAAMFSRANRDISFRPEDGLKVLCFGSIAVYEPRGSYQLIVEKIEPVGVGARQLAFEQLKQRLQKEGLFDPQRKRPLPLMPFSAGIVTSSAGAAVRDILQILAKGAPCVDVVIRPARVQGETAAREIAQGVQDLNDYGKTDVIIISRGGGSTEDLWPFNEEIVARAIAQSRIPTISAVGHQINTTLADLVADVYVETPSAAAKILVDRRNSLLARIDGLKGDAAYEMNDAIHRLRHSLVALRHMLKSPLDRLLEKAQLLDELRSNLDNALRQGIVLYEERLRSFVQRLDALSPLQVLGRGYSLSMKMPTGDIIKSVADVRKGDCLKTVVADGSVVSRVEEVVAS